MVVLSIMLCSTNNCIMRWLFYTSLCYFPHTTISCDGCSIHHYAIFNSQLYHVMVVLFIIMLCSTHTCIMWWLFNPSLCSVQHTSVWLFYPQHITILWWLFYPQHTTIMRWLFYPSCYVQQTTVSCDGCSIHHYAIFHTQLYHVWVVLSIIMLFSTHNCIMWWLFYSSLCFVQHTPVSCDGCSIHHYALFNTQVYGCSTLNI